MTASQARELLGLAAGADGKALVRAYRAAVKAAHPDRPGGDAERLRRVIEAHQLLSSLFEARLNMLPARRAQPRPAPERLKLQISIAEAMAGAERRLEVGGRALDVRIPAGMRPGESVRLANAGAEGANVYVQVVVAAGGGLCLRGHDVWQDCAVASEQLTPCARVEVETPRGARAFSTPLAVRHGSLVRLKGEGLPARGRHPAGDLILRLMLKETAGGGAAEKLRSFSARWAA